MMLGIIVSIVLISVLVAYVYGLIAIIKAFLVFKEYEKNNK